MRPSPKSIEEEHMRLTVWVGTCAILLSTAVIAQDPPKQQEMSAE